MTGRLGAIGLFLAAAGAPLLLAGPASIRPGSVGLASGELDPSTGRALLARCRRIGIPGQYYYEFQLQILPRRGPEQVYRGRLWGGRAGNVPSWRIEVDLGAGAERRWLVRSGPSPAVWQSDNGGRPRSIGSLDPMVKGADITPFDIEFPPSFLFWPKETLVGLNRVLGRPAYIFVLRPPGGFAGRHPEIAGVRSALDTEFDVPLETQLLGPGDRVIKTLSLVDLKKVRGQWIAKEVDVLNERTRNKTRFDVTGAATGLEFSPLLFEPSTLAERVAPPPDRKVERFGS